MKKILPWLVAAGIVTVVFGTIYAVAQQDLRQSANDLPKQIADDAAAHFDSNSPGKFTVSVSGDQPVDIATSLAPFDVLYNRDGHPLAGSGQLHGKLPSIPYGVLTHAKPGHDNTVTWQPESGVRADIVVAKTHDGYVLAGHSIRQTEVHEGQAFILCAIGWFTTMLGLGAGYLLMNYNKKIR